VAGSHNDSFPPRVQVGVVNQKAHIALLGCLSGGEVFLESTMNEVDAVNDGFLDNATTVQQVVKNAFRSGIL
jgi:hypothetical protein